MKNIVNALVFSLFAIVANSPLGGVSALFVSFRQMIFDYEL